MKKHIGLGFMSLFSVCLYAANANSPLRMNDTTQPLRVAVTSFTAPFVMQGNYQQFYGFDISMMQFVCQDMQRQCIYVPMSLNDIYPAIQNHVVDLAVSSIVITPERSKFVQFSMPYMISQGQFIGSKQLAKHTFDLNLLSNKKIGVVQGSAYAAKIGSMGIDNLRAIQFNSGDELIAALKTGTIDVGLLDTHIVHYWQNNSGSTLQALGDPFTIGFGLGVVANRDNSVLIQNVNFAILRYQDSPNFKLNYNQYLDSF
jgi:ABC-type amino acid transport substrate-binding protein